jgi:hypothetical protein
MLFIGKGKVMISELKSQLVAKFEMKDLGATKHILGMEIKRDRLNRNLWLGQSKYANSILQRFDMQDFRTLCLPISVGTKLSISNCLTSPSKMEEMNIVPYQSTIISLMYAMVCTRPDLSQEVGALSKYMSNLGRVHWDAVKRVFRYLCGTLDYSLCYHCNMNEDEISLDIHGYVDLDWVGDVDSR